MPEEFTKEDIDKAVEEKTKDLQEKVDQLEAQLKPQSPDDPFGPTWKPDTAQEMGRDIMAAVEKKFPEMAKSQQDEIADLVVKKMDEKNQQKLEQDKEKQTLETQAQLDYIKQTDPDFNEKQMWEFLKDYKGDQPTTVAQAYQTYKKEYQPPEPKIKEGEPSGEGVEPKAPPVQPDLDKAAGEALAELGLSE